MNAKRFTWLAALAAMLMLLAACGGSADMVADTGVVQVTRVVTETIVEDVELAEADGVTVETAVQPQTRLIIKNGELTIMVVDTDTAVATATQLTADLGGYIISQQIYDVQMGYSAANMRLAVPVTQFENALNQLRQLGEVTNDFAGGEDVTDEFVDLGSRLDNLLATRDRLRSFLDSAETVEEALLINEELKVVEEEIAIIEGRRNFLSDRAAFSTIDLSLQPILPTPTPSPIPTPASWQPGNTAQLAMVNLQESAQQTADFSIYYGIVCGPWLLLLAGFGWIGWRVRRRLIKR